MSETFDLIGEASVRRDSDARTLTLQFYPPDADHVRVSRELLTQMVAAQAEVIGWTLEVAS